MPHLYKNLKRTLTLSLCLLALTTAAQRSANAEDTLTESDYMALLTQASSRVSQTGVPSEDTLSPAFKAIRDRFQQKVKTAEDLDQYLVALEADYKNLKDNDAKLYSLSALVMRDFRSIIWKLRPVARKAKFSHSMLISMVQLAAGFQATFLPTSLWRAGFDYITQPMDPKDKQFQTVRDIQDHFGRVYTSLKIATDRLKAIDLAGTPITWDNQMFFGNVNFQSDLVDRYFFFGHAEKHAMLSLYYASLHNIDVFRAFDMPDLVGATSELAKLMGVDTIAWTGAEGISAEKRTKILRARRSSGKFFNTAGGRALMAEALGNLRESVKYARIAWTELKNRPASRYTIMDSALMQMFQMNRGTDIALANLEAMVKGRAEIRSTISSATVVIDLPAFYSGTSTPKFLADMLPTGFDGYDNGRETKPEEITKYRGLDSYRDYYKGRPTNWSLNAWKPIFPEIKSGAEVGKAARVLAQSWGGSLTALPMLFLVL